MVRLGEEWGNSQPERSLRPGCLTMASHVIRLTTAVVHLAGLVLCAVAVGTPRWFLLSVGGVQMLSVGLFQTCDLLGNNGCSVPKERDPESWAVAAMVLALLGLALSLLGLIMALVNAYLARKGTKSKPVKLLSLVATVLTVACLITSHSLYGSNVDVEIKLFGFIPFLKVTHSLGYSSVLLIISILLHGSVALGHLFDVVMAFN